MSLEEARGLFPFGPRSLGRIDQSPTRSHDSLGQRCTNTPLSLTCMDYILRTQAQIRDRLCWSSLLAGKEIKQEVVVQVEEG